MCSVPFWSDFQSHQKQGYETLPSSHEKPRSKTLKPNRHFQPTKKTTENDLPLTLRKRILHFLASTPADSWAGCLRHQPFGWWQDKALMRSWCFMMFLMFDAVMCFCKYSWLKTGRAKQNGHEKWDITQVGYPSFLKPTFWPNLSTEERLKPPTDKEAYANVNASLQLRLGRLSKCWKHWHYDSRSWRFGSWKIYWTR